MYKETIGIVGGFGGFATCDFFRRLLAKFNTGCERDYPRIIMDNDFTMPSRTRALLYGENIEMVSQMITRSVQRLLDSGADRIVLVCGTAHWFLDDVYNSIPESKERIVDIIEVTAKKLMSNNVNQCYVIAAEGAMKKGVYDKTLLEYGIKVSSPNEKEWNKVRYFLESVKQDKVTDDVKQDFVRFIRGCVGSEHNNKQHVLLGCTELPLLVDEKVNDEFVFVDPLENVLDYLKASLK